MYTTDSSFLSPPVGAARAWADAIRSHNPAQADDIVSAYVTYGAQIGINHDLALAQMCHETGWATSARYVQQKNMAGIGITSSDVTGPTFATIEDGVKAHYEHLVCYTMDADPPVMQQWGMLDPRHTFHDGVPTLSTLERPGVRQWAYPGDGYIDSICAIANSISGGAPPMSNQPTADDIGFPVEYHPAQAHGAEHPISDVQFFVVHDTQGGYDGSLSVLTGPNVSAHALIRRDGLLAFLLPITQSAWAAGNLPVNNAAIQVELENVDYASNDYTDAQYAALAAFFRWCQKQGMTVPPIYIGKRDADGGPLPDVPGIIGHMDVPDGAGGWGGSDHHTDPGPNFDWPRLTSLIQHGTVTPPPPADTRVFSETGQTISGNIKGYWERFRDDTVSIELFGYPVTAVVMEQGHPVQYFERQVLEDHTSEGKGVMGRRLGAEAAQRAGYQGPGIP